MATSVRTNVINFLDVILRVPPLFLIDEVFRIGFGIHYEYRTGGEKQSFLNYGPFEMIEKQNESFFKDLNDSGTKNDYDTSDSYRVVVLSILNFVISLGVCLISLCIFMLKTKQLIPVYLFLLSSASLFLSYNFNDGFVNYIIRGIRGGYSYDSVWSMVIHRSNGFSNITNVMKEHVFSHFSYHVFVQVILSVFFLKVHLGPYYKMLNALIPITFTAPTVLIIFSLPPAIQSHIVIFSTLLPLALNIYVLFSSLCSIAYIIINAYQRAKTFVTNFGLSALLEQEWTRLSVPNVLRTFWVLRIAEHILTLCLVGWGNDGSTIKPAEGEAVTLLMVTRVLLTTGCETMIAVLGMTSVISYICHYIGALFQWILQTDDADDKSIGTVSAILFYILALQTGLTELEPNDRFIRLCRNFCLLFTALLHFIHNIVDPLLMSLSASHNPSTHRHVRALGVCMFLILYPTCLLAYLWSHLQLSTWLLAVSAFSTEVIVKVVVSLMIYSLFLIDAGRLSFWEKLDDYVYYIRAFGNTIEFCFGIFLFFNGAWILFFESGGGVRAGMMCIHAYFNIWCEAKQGWSVFIKRKTAVKKINSLPEASLRQLQEFDDVCAICYQDMVSAKITRCNHFFHGVCLRKWLYVQDRCPLCHEILYKVKSKNSKDKNIIVYMQRDAASGGQTSTNSQTDNASTSETREQGSQTDEINSTNTETNTNETNTDNRGSDDSGDDSSSNDGDKDDGGLRLRSRIVTSLNPNISNLVRNVSVGTCSHNETSTSTTSADNS